MNRVLGFDLARAYSIFGMFIVNFNTIFGSHTQITPLGNFLKLFNGNSSSAFVILSGMGLALMTNRRVYSLEEKKALRGKVLNRSYFLFGLGLVFCLLWPADILHFYGVYMYIAAYLLFLPKNWYLWAAFIATIMFQVLWVFIPFDTGWNFQTLSYLDFWTISGFFRNTLYNGWNPVFPWIGFFLFGMWLGRLDWSSRTTRNKLFSISAAIFLIIEALQFLVVSPYIARLNLIPDLTFYITADYLPPFLPFMLGTSSFAVMILVICHYASLKLSNNKILRALIWTGQMTLTHYIMHLTLGVYTLSFLKEQNFKSIATQQATILPQVILLFAVLFYVFSVLFSTFWMRRFQYGPAEMLMRWLTS